VLSLPPLYSLSLLFLQTKLLCDSVAQAMWLLIWSVVRLPTAHFSLLLPQRQVALISSPLLTVILILLPNIVTTVWLGTGNWSTREGTDRSSVHREVSGRGRYDLIFSCSPHSNRPNPPQPMVLEEGPAQSKSCTAATFRQFPSTQTQGMSWATYLHARDVIQFRANPPKSS